MDKLTVLVKTENDDIILPEKTYEDDACFDIRSKNEYILEPYVPTIIETGLAFEFPNDYKLCLYSRSGLSSKGVILLNSVGIIDPNFRGFIKVPLINLTRNAVKINKNDRIAQIALEKVNNIDFIKVQDLTTTERGNNGFGSTGRV